MNKKGTGTREEVRRLYVESQEDHTFATLSEATGYAASTLKRWSLTDLIGPWAKQRDRYRTNLRKSTEEKTIEKLSDKLSDKYSEIQERHYNSYRVFTELASYYGKVKVRALKKAEEDGLERVVEELAKINPTSVNFWNLVLDRSLKGETASLGLSFYVNEQSAIDQTERMGYSIVELPEGVSKEDLQNVIDSLAQRPPNEVAHLKVV